MRRTIFIAFIFLLLISCQTGMQKHREQARQGLLTLGLNRNAILAEWGLPDRTSTILSDEFMEISAGWGLGSGRFGYFKGKIPLDVWFYEKKECTLVFQGVKLVGWKTEKTVKELRSPRK